VIPLGHAATIASGWRLALTGTKASSEPNCPHLHKIRVSISIAHLSGANNVFPFGTNRALYISEPSGAFARWTDCSATPSEFDLRKLSLEHEVEGSSSTLYTSVCFAADTDAVSGLLLHVPRQAHGVSALTFALS
jgi:hypothetical protein